jgi:hypothetical protein
MIADFGTDYTGIGWLTLVLPVGFVALVAGLLVRSFKRSESRDGEPPSGSSQ